MNSYLKNTQIAFVLGLLNVILFFTLNLFIDYFFEIFSNLDSIIIIVLLSSFAISSSFELFHSIKSLKEPYKEELSKFLIAFCCNAIFLPFGFL